MVKPIIREGDKYGKLTAIEFSYKDKWKRQYWLFKCDCGKEKIICVSNVKYNNTKSCGCLHKSIMKNAVFNFRHGMVGTRIYKSWGKMKERCLNKNDKNYKNYGGRGIKICPEWLNSFENFFKDMGERPKNKTLDRIDNNKGYCKKNCRWATQEEQHNNKRSNHFLTYKNKTQTIAQWSKELGIHYYTIYSRLRRGCSIEKILKIGRVVGV